MVSTNLSKQKGGFGGCGARVNTPGVTEAFVGGKRRRSRGRSSKRSKSRSPKRSRSRSKGRKSPKRSRSRSPKRSRKKSRSPKRSSGSNKRRTKKRRSGKKRKGAKSKPIAKKYCGDNLTNPNLSALCMTCYHSSGKKTKQSIMAVAGRECRQTRSGGIMILGKCEKCGGKMAKIVAKKQ